MAARSHPVLSALLLLHAGCVVVRDFGASGEEDTTGAADSTDSGEGDAGWEGPGEASESTGEPLPEDEEGSWESLWSQPGGEARYYGIDLTPGGEVVAVGLAFDGGVHQGLFHRFSSGGQLIEHALVPGAGLLQIHDVCVRGDGGLYMAGTDFVESGQPALLTVKTSVDGPLLGYEGAVEPAGWPINVIPSVACVGGEAWLKVSGETSSSLARFGEGGYLGELGFPGTLEAFDSNGSSVDLLVTEQEDEPTHWVRRDLDGVVLSDQILDGDAIAIDARGPWVAITGRNAGGDWELSLREGTGEPLWSLDELDGQGFSVQQMALGPEGELAAELGLDDGSRRFVLFSAEGALSWSTVFELPEGSEGWGERLVLDMAIDDQGRVLVAGLTQWTEAGGSSRFDAWLTRMVPPA